MKNMILKWVVAWLAQTVTDAKVKEWMNEGKAKLVPVLEGWRIDLLAALKPKVLESETKIDDMGFKAFEVASLQIINWLKNAK